MPLDWDRTKEVYGVVCAVCGKPADASIGLTARTVEKPTRSIGGRTRKLCRQHAEEIYDSMENVLKEAVS